MDTKPTALERAIEAAGTQNKLAKAIGTTQSHIAMMKKRGKVAAELVLKIEKATGVSRHDLRRDLYPLERKPRKRKVNS